jgi:hypothetical protein
MLCCITAQADESADWTLDRLMQALAGVQQHQARFTETRELSLLQQELTSNGSLSFQRPGRLIKQFDPPSGLRYEIDANRLLIRKQDGSEETIRLDNSPHLLAYVAAMRAVLAGDLQRLQRFFELRINGSSEEWQLLLTPKQTGLARQVKQVEVSGSHHHINRFLILEQGGDRIITRLHKPHVP